MEKQQLAQILETQRQNFKFTLQQQEQRSGQIIRELRDGQKGMLEGMPAFQEKLELYKSELASNSLVCSEERYVELRTKPNTSLKEFIQIRVYEALQNNSREAERLRVEAQEAIQ